MSTTLVEKYKNYLQERQSENISEKINEFITFSKGIKLEKVCDEFIDFYDMLLKKPTRWQAFRRYIETRFPKKQYPSILDVGCGIFAELSLDLVSKGYTVSSIDPKVTEKENLKTIKGLFDFKTTDVSSYNLIVGLEPCDATEHIIRSAILNNKSFCICLCGVPHKNIITGKIFENRDEWIEYLLKIDPSIIFEKKTILEKSMSIIRSN